MIPRHLPIVMLAALLAAGSGHAGIVFTWNGGGADDLWTNVNNWAGMSAPPLDVGGNSLVFGSTGMVDQSPDVAGNDFFNIGSLAFTGADAMLTLTDSQGTGSLSFVDGATITNDSLLLQTIDIDLVGNGSDLFLTALTADLAVGGGIDLSDTSGVKLTIGGAENVTITGRITGSGGSLEIDFDADDDVVTLSGDNTYTGGTTLTQGILVLGSDTALGTGDLFLGGDASVQSDDDDRVMANDIRTQGNQLTVSGASDLALNGRIRGNGSLLIDLDADDTVLTLGSNNSFAGGTTLNRGTVVLGSDAALGTGDLTLTGDGTLQADSNGREIDNDIDNGGFLLTISGERNMILNGIISGAGGFTMDFASDRILRLTGDSTYTGMTTLRRGTLVLGEDGARATLASPVTVTNAATLAGEGALADLTNQSGGTVAPGNLGDDIGRLDVNGDYVQASGSTLVVQLSANSGRSDLVDATGTATLEASSTIEATLMGDGYIVSGQSFDIIRADGGVTDNGARLETGSATVTVRLDLDPDFVNGNTNYALELIRAANAYSAAAVGVNNRSIGRGLDSLIPAADADPRGIVGRLLGSLDALGADDYNTSVSELSPEPFNSTTVVSRDNTLQYVIEQSTYLAGLRSGIQSFPAMPAPPAGAMVLSENDPLLLATAIAQAEAAPAEPAAPSDPKWGRYAKVQGTWLDQDPTLNRTGFSATSFGGQFGLDYSFSPSFVAGVAVGYTFTDTDLSLDLGTITQHTVRAGPYLSVYEGNWYLDGSATFGYYFIESDRSIPSLGATASADSNGYDITGYLGSGYHVRLDRNLHLTPIGSVLYSHFEFEDFVETGAAGASLRVAERSDDSLRTRLGANLSYRIENLAWQPIPYVYAGWEHEFYDDSDLVSAFAAGGSPFVIDTGARDSDAFFVGAGVNVLVNRNVAGFVRLEHLQAETSSATGFAAGVSVAF